MRFRRSLAGSSLLGLVASMAVISSPAVADDPPADEVVSFNDFSDGSWDPWVASGSAELSIVDVDGDAALAIGGRDADYIGIQTPEGLLTEGQQYTFSMRARLAEGTDGTAGVRWVMKPAYTWGPNETMTADGWTTVTATYTAPADGQVYIGTGDLTGATSYTYLVDDLRITTPTDVAGTQTIWSLDFDDDAHDPWTNNGGTLAFVGEGDGSALSITRSEDYHGIKSPVGELEHGVEYTFSMRARLPEGTAGSREIRFVVEPQYNWVANTTIDGDGWTDISGTYILPADADASASAIYLGTSGDSGDSYTVLVDDVLVTAPSDTGGPVTEVDLSFDFEDGTLQGWQPRDAGGEPTVSVTDTEAHDGTFAALVSEREVHGDGIGYDVSDIFEPGGAYDITAWVKMAEGAGTEDIWLSARTTVGTSTSFGTVGQFTGVTDSGWRQVSATYTAPTAEEIFLYFETAYPDGGTGDFLVDDITIRSQAPAVIQDLLPIHERHADHFPVGVAIDERETLGAPADLATLHFNQVTAENHMKPDAFYDGPSSFRVHPQATAIMDFAQANDLAVYGHVLVWHSQTPDWFFQDAAGEPLSTSDADQELLRERMRTHIFDVAEAFADDYGPYGSDTNPLNAWDVVNEVVSDSGEFDDGLRRSEWYRILGEEFIDLAFIYADEAFNDVYAAEGTDRPVTLFINDYNTEQSGKQSRYLALIERLIDRGVPIDGVGHQFHLSLSMPVSALETALVNTQELGLIQAVTEMDVTVGTPVTDANIIEQGYYYRDAFRVFRDYSDDLYAVTLWGLTDNRSWRSAQAPLAFDANLQAKPAYYGIVDAELETRLRTANVFRGSVALDDDAAEALEWSQLPLHEIDTGTAFQSRWESDHLTVYVEVEDSSVDAADGVEFVYEGETAQVGRDGSGDVDAVVTETDDGYVVVAHLPLPAAVDEGGTLSFDVRVTDGASTVAWNDPGAMGTLTLVEELSYVEVVEASSAPTIDGSIDDVWGTANTVTTDKHIGGPDPDGATADVRTLWMDNTLYVLAEVDDPIIDVSGSDPWVQDSLEIFVDAGNYRNGPYRYDDTQIRINVENRVSFGTGDEAFQAARVESATSVVDGGYIIEASISLLEEGGEGTFHGLDFQVNDGTAGARTSIHSWADPTGLGYQSTARWGVAQLIAADDVDPVDPVDPEDPCDETISGRHNGTLVATSGVTCLEGADIRGGVWVGPKAGLIADDTDVRGGITAVKASRLEVRDSTVRGGITAMWGRGPIVIAGNDVRGGVQLVANLTAPDRAVVAGNTIRGPLLCLANHPAPTNNGSRNQVSGGSWVQCWRM